MGDRVVKLFSGSATPLFANDAATEWRCLTHLAGTGLAPDPIDRRETPHGTVLVYTFIPGTFGTNRAATLALLDRLHSTPPPAIAPVATGEAVLTEGTAMLRPNDPLHALRPKAPPEPTAPVFLHRDAVPANIIGKSLIDWQAPGIGDPAEDIAHAISPAMALLYGGTDAPPPPNYPQSAAAYHWRMAAYCQWQVDRGSAAYAPARDAEIRFLHQLMDLPPNPQ